MSTAQQLVAVAREAGFRESGVTATKARTIAGIRCSLRLEVCCHKPSYVQSTSLLCLKRAGTYLTSVPCLTCLMQPRPTKLWLHPVVSALAASFSQAWRDGCASHGCRVALLASGSVTSRFVPLKQLNSCDLALLASGTANSKHSCQLKLNSFRWHFHLHCKDGESTQ